MFTVSTDPLLSDKSHNLAKYIAPVILPGYVLKTGSEAVVYFDIMDSELLEMITNSQKLRSIYVRSEIGRPDLLTESIYGYGDPWLWWIVMEINGLLFPSDIKAGMRIKFLTKPDLDDMIAKCRLMNKSSDTAVSPVSVSSRSTFTRIY